MKRLLVFFFCLAISYACNDHHYNQDLIRIESIIQSEPEQALQVLTLMHPDYSSDADRGLFSLLYSIALDKNYIDVRSDSIIRPAVLYFRKGNDCYRTFLTYYYLGRVYENAESYDEALSAFIIAEKHIGHSIPEDYMSRLFTAKERVYFHQFAMDRALEEARKAKQHSLPLDNYAFYIRSCLDIANILNIEQLHAEEAEELDSLRQWMIMHNAPFPSDYYYYLINNQIYDSTYDEDSLRSYFTSYTEACALENREPDSLLLADILVKSHEYKRAEELFGRIHLGPDSQTVDSISYYTTAAGIYKGLKDFDNYVTASQKSRAIIERMNNNIFNKDIRFLEERYNNQISLEKRKHTNMILSLCVGVLMLLITLACVIFIRDKREMQRLLNEARNDYSLIKMAFANSGEAESDIARQLSSRLQVLTPYFQSEPSKPLGRNELASLKRDNHEMLRNIGLIFSLSFPGFVSNLIEHGLNAEEVGMCALYASGYITKELSDLFEGNGINLINKNIRIKLGNEVIGRTIPSYIRDMFEKACPRDE